MFCVSAAVSCLLSALTLDLSQYAMDIGKAVSSKTQLSLNLMLSCQGEVFSLLKYFCVTGQLKANNAQLMEEAVQAMQNLVRQCSDPTAVQDIVTHLFKILGGEISSGGHCPGSHP